MIKCIIRFPSVIKHLKSLEISKALFQRMTRSRKIARHSIATWIGALNNYVGKFGKEIAKRKIPRAEGRRRNRAR